jgi:hypothetical protein
MNKKARQTKRYRKIKVCGISLLIQFQIMMRIEKKFIERAPHLRILKMTKLLNIK